MQHIKNYSLKYKLAGNEKPLLQLYNILGSHIVCNNKAQGVRFSVIAPNAKEVRVVGNFNNWDGTLHIMKRKNNSGIWTLFIEGIMEWEIYKYEIHTFDGHSFMKADPFAFYSEERPSTASKVVNLKGYKWHDKRWLNKRQKKPIYDKPMNIYEVHLGSWKRTENNEFLDYRTIADELSEYVSQMGYTHIELLPLTEHPLDDSWGYQSTGYFSVTSRFGSPKDFMYFVDKFHQRGIGVILDWVPSHFCKDSHGLYRFDGTALYEYSDSGKGENYQWGTANFDLSKPLVRRFLLSSALFWFDTYHIDGIRVDAVANIIYWGNGTENLEAIGFLKALNKAIFKYYPNVLSTAEDSSAFPAVTSPTYAGGLGFNYKWNMGWMNDMLKYMQLDPLYRKHNHNLITFSLMYAFSENFILPLSHDEVVHGKKSLLDKMPGDYWQKFASLRMFYAYMMGHPGKKLLFMGGELGQFIEWRFGSELDWSLLEYPMHNSMQMYVKDLNNFYKAKESLWEQDHSYEGFQWIDHENKDLSIISFMRKGLKKNSFIIVVCNFTPMVYEDYKIGVPKLTKYKETFNSDSSCYGGSNKTNEELLLAVNEGWHNQQFHIKIKIPPLGTIFIEPEIKTRKKNINKK